MFIVGENKLWYSLGKKIRNVLKMHTYAWEIAICVIYIHMSHVFVYVKKRTGREDWSGLWNF